MTVRWFPLLFLWSVVSAHGDQPPKTPRPASDVSQGQRLFASRCARCHGLKGTGGTGPSLARARLRRAADDESLFALIQEGIPGTEMTGDWTLSDREARHVAAYLRSLGRSEAAALPGDAAKGKALYAKSDCAKCHVVNGQGGTIGPDLSDVGNRRGPAHLRQVLREPGLSKLIDAEGFFTFLPVQIATLDGHVYQGVRVNEDSFTIVLRDAHNAVHTIDKHDVAEMKREPESSVMPSYARTLSAREIDDLVAFLAGLRGD